MSNLAPSRSSSRRLFALLIAVIGVMSWITSSVYSAKEPAAILAAPNAVQSQTDSIRQIPLASNDIIYNPSDQTIYASLPSNAGARGNSIAAINPVTGTVTSSVFIGSEPSKLALSDDGHTLYAALNGAYAVRRFDTATQTPGAQFSLGQDSFSGRYLANDLAVAPGNPNLLAVVRFYTTSSPPEAGVAVFDNGVQRPATGPGHNAGSDFLAFSNTSPSTLYGGGYFYGLRTMTIDNTGVTVNSTTSFTVGARIKFDNNLIFSSSGQVINPAGGGTLLGTFSGVNSLAFVPDSTVGRAYYLVSNGSGSYTLKAFDINTFVPVGSLNITGVSGDVSNLVRWGANGLAFRTAGGQLFLIQTSLIPSSEPIPTPTPTPVPTPTPTPTPYDTFVRQINATTNDLIYNSTTQKLFASVPSSVGSKGNSLMTIDPATGEVGNSVFVGSEPNKLAASDDGQTLYVVLEGAGSARRFDMTSQTAGAQFYLGSDFYEGPYSISDLAVSPGNPDVIAVARQLRGVSPSEAGVAVFDNGVRRPATGPGHSDGSDYLVFSPSASTLYGGGIYSGLTTMTVNSNGVTVLGKVPFNVGNSVKLVNGLIYGSAGQVINPNTGGLVGTFTGLIDSSYYTEYTSLIAPDSANGRVFFITSQNSVVKLRAYDINTFLPIGSVTLNGIVGTPSSLTRWGTNGLAFRTSSNRVYSIQTSLVNSSALVPSPTPTPTPSPTPTPTYIPTFIKKVNLPANGLVYTESTQTLHASVPSTAGVGLGNTITQINPQTGAIGPSAFIGSEPSKMALSDDDRTVYVNLVGASAIRRFDLVNRTPGLQFSVGVQYPADFDVVPGNPDSLAVSIGNTANGISIYDNGVKRGNSSSNYTYVSPIEFGASPSRLYGYNSNSTGYDLVTYSVDNNGVTPVGTVRSLIDGFNSGLKFSNGLLYSLGGRVADPEAQTLAGTFVRTITDVSTMCIDQANRRIYFITSVSGSSYGQTGIVLFAYDLDTYLPVGTTTFAGVYGTPINLVRWGANGLAFNTVPASFGTPASDSAVYLVQTALVSPSAPIPTGLLFSPTSYITNDSAYYGSGQSVTLTVARTGDLAIASTVDYTTVDGTATAGADYAPTSGTLNFAAGESSKTITVPIIADNVYEGDETFSLLLSNPTGGDPVITYGTATIKIYDGSSQPYLTINDLNYIFPLNGPAVATFNVNLSNPTTKTVTINYATADGSAIAGSDYVATSGTLTFNPLETSKTVQIAINRNSPNHGSRNFFLNLSNVVNAYLYDTQGVCTILDVAPTGSLIISEFRFRGAAGADDEFVEFYNNTDAPLTITTADGSNGWALVGSDGASRVTLLNNTVIPARAHYLATNNSNGGYSLGAIATGNRFYTTGFPDNTGMALYRTSNPQNFTPANLLDAVGFNGVAAPYFQGTPLPLVGTLDGEYSFVRKTSTATNLPVNTNDNAADFMFVSTTGESFGGAVSSTLGAPGPENITSPVANNSVVPSLVDPLACTACAPNRFRNGSGNSGTLSIRRKFTNNTGATVNTLRFRVFDITTLNSPIVGAPPQADLRLTDSTDVTMTDSLGQTLTVKGTTLNQTPAQTLGGGVNSILNVALPEGLANGSEINVQFLMNVMQNGRFRFFVTLEALP